MGRMYGLAAGALFTVVGFFGWAQAQVVPGSLANLPPPLVLTYPPVIPTLDGSGNHVGRMSSVVLKLSREYTPTNQLMTRYELQYFYGNGNAGETWRGEQHFTIDLLSRHRGVVVRNVLGNVELPRYRCWYGGGATQFVPAGYVKFDYTHKHIRSMQINVSRVTGVQTPC